MDFQNGSISEVFEFNPVLLDGLKINLNLNHKTTTTERDHLVNALATVLENPISRHLPFLRNIIVSSAEQNKFPNECKQTSRCYFNLQEKNSLIRKIIDH